MKKENGEEKGGVMMEELDENDIGDVSQWL